MYLKSLEVQGFKSFADKICLDFNSGITSVVGPNGSGKSNISDAIRWVLGEQSAKTLRGGKMEDVIFAGTEHRKPLGFAEVSLTIDNSSGRLPVAYTEVTVTRRVFRSGESEFLINKTSCRLKDIHELFMDTGIGRDGYSIIGQGRVDEILSSRSEDRRAIFEEASGIMKYKVRKQEAEKKLESVEQNLVRIHDIVSELESQMGPLEKQAEVAKKYLQYRDSLKEIEVSVFVESIEKLQQKSIELNEKYSVLQAQIELETNTLAQKEQKSKDSGDREKQWEATTTHLRQEYFELETLMEKTNSEIALEHEKIQHLKENILKAEQDISHSVNKSLEMKMETEQKEQRKTYLQLKKLEYTQALSEQEKRLNNLLSHLNEGERHIENLKSSILEKMNLTSDKKTQIAGSKSQMEGMQIRKNNITTEIYRMNLEKDKELIKKEELENQISESSKAIALLQKKLEKFHLEKKDALHTIEEEKKKLSENKADHQFKTSRQTMLQNMERNFEGYHKSVRMLLQQCQSNAEFGHGIYGALAQLISVDKAYATAIEMVLGSALQNVVTSTEEDAKRAIEYLKKNKIGRATFLPISAVKGKYLDKNDVEELKKTPNFCGVASDLVSVSDEFKGIVLNLLGKVVVVKDLDTGIKLSRKFKYGFRIVTLDGDILNTTGAMSGGSNENRESGLLNRSNEIQQIDLELKQLLKAIQMHDDNIQELTRMINEINKELAETEAKQKESELTNIRDQSQLVQIEEFLNRDTAKVEMLQEEKNQLDRQMQDISSEMQKYQTELETIELEIENTRNVILKYQEEHKGGKEERDDLHETITDLKIALSSANESLDSIEETLSKMQVESIELTKMTDGRQREMQEAQVKIKLLELEIEKQKDNIKVIEGQKELKDKEIFASTEERKNLQEIMEILQKDIQNLHKNLRLLSDEMNRIEVSKARSESESDSLRNRLWDEYELTYTNAKEIKKDIGNLTAAQKQIHDLKNSIRALGAINIAAIDEFIKTKERYEFMSTQKDDLLSTKEKLHTVIQEMTVIMKKQFMDQFRLINENFAAVFKELFDGGRAELILMEPDNVLESGVEIEVQPPGKKLQNMMLLSGGERAFTAIALLFSILKLRPTPFCLLDEIEAALDEANVNRFAQYVKKHTHLTQFLVITHRKGTMEASESLYGVTMQEHGVSKVVSMKLEERAS